jgi:hypothetical protein
MWGAGEMIQILAGNRKGRDSVGYISADKKIILEWILKNKERTRLQAGFIWSQIGQSRGLL